MACGKSASGVMTGCSTGLKDNRTCLPELVVDGMSLLY